MITLCLCGCGKEAKGKSGYSRGHWSKRIEDRFKISLGTRKRDEYNLSDKKLCLGCNKEKLVSEFYGKARGKFCIQCRKDRLNLRNRSRTKEEQKNSFIKCKYGINLDQYKEMLDKQKGLCAICHEPETRINQYGLCLLHIDHNHTTGKVRGLLCHKCNSLLGYSRENKEILKSSINYLELNGG